MPIVFRELHPSSSQVSLNEEWFVVENTGERPFSTGGCVVCVGRGRTRLRVVGTIDPGFTLGPGERVRVITGNPGKKAHGAPPAEDNDLRNYHLFLGAPLLPGPGAVIVVALKQHELARATFDPAAPHGVAPTTNGRSHAHP